MHEIFKIDTLEALREYIQSVAADQLRPALLAAFGRLVNYQNIKEWNELVRVCEALQLTGWGDHEPFEAIAEQWINGAFYTEMQNSFFEKKPAWSKRWRKQHETFILAEGTDTTDYGISKFTSQRNKLPKSPIRWTRSGNYQRSVQPLIDSLEMLKNKMVRQTRPELYGDAFSYLGIQLCFSHHDDESPSVRYEYFHGEAEVPNDFKGAKNPGGMPAYYIRPRLDIGKLATKNNELRLVVTRHFTKAFGELDLSEQQQILRADFLEMLTIVAEKLKKKKIKYDIELLTQDAEKILSEWCRQ